MLDIKKKKKGTIWETPAYVKRSSLRKWSRDDEEIKAGNFRPKEMSPQTAIQLLSKIKIPLHLNISQDEEEIFVFFLWPCHVSVGSQFSHQGLNPGHSSESP